MPTRTPRGKLFVVSGPSGVGKGTVLSAVLERLPPLRKSVSVTTRPRSPCEIPGAEYEFVSEAEFSEMLEYDAFLEWAEVHGHRYGTPRAWVEAQLAEGTDVVLEIDVQGGMQIRDQMPEARLVFIGPPSMQELERRIRGRGRDDEAAIHRRLHQASHEMQYAGSYDYMVVNDDLDHAVDRVTEILTRESASGGAETSTP